MKMDAKLKDKQDLVAGVYALEIINAKEMNRKKVPQRAQIVIEFLVTAGPEYLNGDPSEGHEHTEFLDVTFEGLEGKGLKMFEERVQNFVKAIEKTMDEFREMEAEDLIGLKVNATIINDSYQGEIRTKIKAYSVFTD
jgi:hypothetical protein